MSQAEICYQPSSVDITVTARTVKRLFADCASALATILTEQEASHLKHRQSTTLDFNKTINVSAVDRVSLLVEWLSELISVSDLDSVVIDEVRIHSIDDLSLSSKVNGYGVKSFVRTISSVDYDTVKIEHIDGQYRASFRLQS